MATPAAKTRLFGIYWPQIGSKYRREESDKHLVLGNNDVTNGDLPRQEIGHYRNDMSNIGI